MQEKKYTPYSNQKQENLIKKNKKNSQHILSGYKPVMEVLEKEPNKIDHLYLRKGRNIKESNRILSLCKEHSIRHTVVGDDVLHRLCDNVNHQGIAARLREVGYVPYEHLLETAFEAPLPLIVALDQVLDPGNVGTLVRTMYAMGAAGLVVPKHNSAFLGAGASRSAAGSLEKLPIAEVVNLARSVELAEKSGYTAYYADMHGKNALLQETQEGLRFPALLVLGSEEKGVRQGVRNHCSCALSIPFLREFDSLNVAQAGAVLLASFFQAHSKRFACEMNETQVPAK